LDVKYNYRDMNQTIAILGRQPALGRAELESLFGANSVKPIGDVAMLIDQPPDTIAFTRLGGTVKLCKLLTYLPYADWEQIEKYLAETLPKHLQDIPEGKIRLGLSVYGLPVSIRRLNATGLELKKIVKSAGRSVRVVPNNTAELNAAQVIHNQLTGPTGLELVLIKHGKETVLAQTVAIQDIAAYTARDQARPKRDARVGMLPPKLAQIIVNLAIDQKELVGPLLDPFCGTGVILQEALLMEIDAYGSDIDPRMVAYTQENLKWLNNKYGLPNGNLSMWFSLEAADATSAVFPSQHRVPIQVIASETYLGRPFSALPKPDVLNEVIRDVDTIVKKFLKNVAKQTNPGFRMCIAVPAWKLQNGFRHLPVLDQLTDLGYTRLSFVHVRNDQLIYHRPEQIVARELIVLQRI